MNPLVSICCITYNQKNFIRDALEGFLMQQTSFSFEILIHDDASTDGTPEVIHEYEKQYPNIIKAICQPENKYSQGESINELYNFPRAKGKYLALCEGDDYWTDPLKLQKQVDLLETYPNMGMVCTGFTTLDMSTNSIHKQSAGNESAMLRGIMDRGKIVTATTLFRKSLYEQYAAELDIENIRFWKMNDYPLWMWFLKKSSVFYLSDLTSVYRLLPASASHFQHDWSRAQQFHQSFIEITKYLHEKKIITHAEYIQEVQTSFCNNCHIFIMTGRKRDFIKVLWLLLRRHQFRQFAKLSYLFMSRLFHS